MACKHFQSVSMSKESKIVFVKFGGLFLGAILLISGINNIAQAIDPSTFSKLFQFSSGDTHEGRQMMNYNGCFSCHSIDGFGGDVGPELNGVVKRKSKQELFDWMKAPWKIKPGTRMPQFQLSDKEIETIINYLTTKDSMQVRT